MVLFSARRFAHAFVVASMTGVPAPLVFSLLAMLTSGCACRQTGLACCW